MGEAYEIVVVGAGHAGCEAAFVAARMGCRVALVTSKLGTLGLMPCNPAVGGLAKSHLVAELDALGGEMGLNADLTGLQYKTLNASRGPAVRAVRVQCDKARYTARLARVAAGLPNLTLVEGTMADLRFAAGRPVAVLLRGGGEVRDVEVGADGVHALVEVGLYAVERGVFHQRDELGRG